MVSLRRLKNTSAMKSLHARRRAAGICINQPNEGKEHGKPVRAGRCEECWQAKLDGDKQRRAESVKAAGGWEWRGKVRKRRC